MSKKNGGVWLAVPALLAAGAAGALSVGYMGARKFTVQNIFYKTSRLPAGRKVRIAQLSDLHLGQHFKVEKLAGVVAKTAALAPDILVFTGDLFDSRDKWGEFTQELVLRLLDHLPAKATKLAVLGNHDFRGDGCGLTAALLQTAGFRVLRNEAVTLAQWGIRAIGVDDILLGDGCLCPVGDLCDEKLFNLALVHEPDAADIFSEYPIDLQLSGHTHGRQINLPLVSDFILPHMGDRYISGRYIIHKEGGRDMRVYVNRGIGTTKLPLRFLCGAEITCIDIKGE